MTPECPVPDPRPASHPHQHTAKEPLMGITVNGLAELKKLMRQRPGFQ